MNKSASSGRLIHPSSFSLHHHDYNDSCKRFQRRLAGGFLSRPEQRVRFFFRIGPSRMRIWQAVRSWQRLPWRAAGRAAI